jgi:hypothetical protein
MTKNPFEKEGFCYHFLLKALEAEKEKGEAKPKNF